MILDPRYPFLGAVAPASPREQAVFDRFALDARDRDVPADLVRRVNLEPHERLNGGLTPAAYGSKRVRMLQDWQGYSAGDVVGFNARIARQLLELGVAEAGPQPEKRTLGEIRDALTGKR